MPIGMHHSRLAGFIIDCKDTAPDDAAAFWSGALGMRSLGEDGPLYVVLDASARDIHVEVQRVSHESRVHLDIETDDRAAEVARLEKLGARKVGEAEKPEGEAVGRPVGWAATGAPCATRLGCVVCSCRAIPSRATTSARAT